MSTFLQSLPPDPDDEIDYFADTDFWGDNDDMDEWTEDEEEELLSWGICPECGAELGICDHGDPELDQHWGDDDDY